MISTLSLGLPRVVIAMAVGLLSFGVGTFTLGRKFEGLRARERQTSTEVASLRGDVAQIGATLRRQFLRIDDALTHIFEWRAGQARWQGRVEAKVDIHGEQLERLARNLRAVEMLPRRATG